MPCSPSTISPPNTGNTYGPRTRSRALLPPCGTARSVRRAVCRIRRPSRWCSSWSMRRRKAGAGSMATTSCPSSFKVSGSPMGSKSPLTRRPRYPKPPPPEPLGHHQNSAIALCWFLAVSVLSLGSATAIGFAAPLFTTLLSIVILKEKVGIHRWLALIIGFIGVLIITHPGAGTLTYGALFALGNAVLISTVAIAIRRMSMTESAETLTLYQMSIMTLCTACLLTLGFRDPHWGDVLMIALAGIGNGIAQFWWTRSLSLAPPSAVVPFNYLSLVWATILGFAVWGDVPTLDLLIGSAIVVASGLYILWRETRRRRTA